MSRTHEEAWSYAPGEWYAVFGARVLLAVPPSEKARVGGLWEIVEDGAGFDETLDALIATGLRDLPGFVLVSASSRSTRVVIRGPATVSCTVDDDDVVIEGDTQAIWVERTVRGVSRTRIEVAGPPDGDGPVIDDLTVVAGLVRLRAAEHPVPVPPAPEPTAEPVAPTLPPTGPPTAPPIGPPPSGPPLGQPTGPMTAPLSAVSADDHDGLTSSGGSDDSVPLRPPPGIPGQPPAPDVTARPVARLLFSHGPSVDVDRVVLVGRAPVARRLATSTEEPRLISVSSPQHEISSTHLEVRPGSGADHGYAVVTDLGSTNGSVLVQPGLPPEDLKPGAPVQLIPGAILDLGDGVTIQVVNP